MKTMAMLVYKDLVQQRRRLLIGCVMLLIFGLQFVMSGQAGPGSIGGIVGGLIVVSTLGTAYDEDRGGLVFLRSLPLTARDITASKFVSALSFAALFSVVTLIPVRLFGHDSQAWRVLAPAVVAAACTALVISACALTVFFRHGYRSAQLFLMYFAAGVTGLGLASELLLRSGRLKGFQWSARQQHWLHALAVWAAVSVWRPVMLILIVSGMLYLLLALLATRSLRNRDL